MSVLRLIGEVSMPRAVEVAELRVVLAPCVGVVDDEGNGSAQRPSLIEAREEAHLVALAPWGREVASPALSTT